VANKASRPNTKKWLKPAWAKRRRSAPRKSRLKRKNVSVPPLQRSKVTILQQRSWMKPPLAKPHCVKLQRRLPSGRWQRWRRFVNVLKRLRNQKSKRQLLQARVSPRKQHSGKRRKSAPKRKN
jgi:hypothetical protein